jgi:formyl-CoA transferase
VSESALGNIVVLDLTRALAGPYCTMTLADLGAEVIKVEIPGRGDDSRQWGPPFAAGESAYYLCANRGKKSLTLNLKTEQGREIVRQLAERADVLVENFYTGTMDEWGLGYEALRTLNPRLIYCAITGYGQTGPYRHRPGYDFITQAQGGIMSVTGPEEGPPMKVGVSIVDVTAGMNAALAILAALFEWATSGEGQYLDIALLDTQVAWLANVGSNYLVSGRPPARLGNGHPNIVPYGPFPTQDGWIAIAAANDRQWQELCALAGWSDLVADPRYATNPLRVENRRTLIPTLEERFRQRTSAEWEQSLLQVNIPCSPINTLDQVFADLQVLARDMLVEVPHPTAGNVRLIGSPLKLSRTPVRLEQPPPLLGQHTAEVLVELGYSQEEIDRLRDQGIV